MTEPIPRSKLLFARVVVGVMAAFVLGGILWYGLSPQNFARLWQNLVERPDGPMLFRFFLQPTMATITAVVIGIKDARAGRTPFMQAVVTSPAERAGRLNEAMVDTSRIMLLGLVMDIAYQYLVFDTFHPGEAVIITLLLALVPYLLVRGPAARIARRWVAPGSAQGVR